MISRLREAAHAFQEALAGAILALTVGYIVLALLDWLKDPEPGFHAYLRGYRRA